MSLFNNSEAEMGRRKILGRDSDITNSRRISFTRRTGIKGVEKQVPVREIFNEPVDKQSWYDGLWHLDQ